MKRIYYIGLWACLTLFLTACSDVVKFNDEKEDLFSNNGSPVISAVYDATNDDAAPITAGVLKQFIRLNGQNLANPKHVNINGVEVDVRDIYAESANSWIHIPRIVPDSPTGIMVYETQQGSVTINFDVTIPHMELEGLENEFVLPGNEVKVKGDYFDLFEFNDTTDASTASIVITNDALGYRQVIKTDSCTEDYTGIVIPKDCPDNSLITFSWQEMGQNYSKSIPYRMADQLMFGNFDGDLGWWNDWGRGLVTDGTKEGDPVSLGYNFLRLTGTFGAWDWNSTGFGCNWRWLDASANPENYVVKFEVWTNSSNPFYSYGTNDVYNDKNGGYCFTMNNGEPRRQFDPVSEFNLTNTYGKWVTVAMPLDEMIQNKPLPTSPDQWVNFEFVCQPNPVDGVSAWNVDHAWGQFRIEPRNY